jgi:hypothetical protein
MAEFGLEGVSVSRGRSRLIARSMTTLLVVSIMLVSAQQSWAAPFTLEILGWTDEGYGEPS